MLTAFEATICIAPVVVAFRFAAAEFGRMRRTRQINRALAFAIGSSLTA